MVIGRATICCSAIFFLTALFADPLAQEAEKERPFFPASIAWSVPLDAPLSAAPIVSNTVGYFPLANGTLHAYDLTTGSHLWTASIKTALRPAAGEQLLFVAEADAITALRLDSGKPEWRTALPAGPGVAPVWQAGWLMTISTAGTLTAHRASDGHAIWEANLEAEPTTSPAIEGNQIYVGTADNRMVARRVETGEVQWTRTLGGAPHELLAINDRVYVGASDKYFYSLKAADGEVDWRWRLGGVVVGTPASDDRHVYFLALDNAARAINLRSGAQRWIRNLLLRPNTGPVRVGSALVISGISPTIYAYDARTGAAQGTMDAPGEVASPPLVVDSDGLQLLVVVTRDVARGSTIVGFQPRAGSRPSEAATP